MARTAKEIQEQIDKLEAARRVTRARNGYAHYSERISYLQGELMLQKAKEGGESHEHRWIKSPGLVTCSVCKHESRVGYYVR